MDHWQTVVTLGIGTVLGAVLSFVGQWILNWQQHGWTVDLIERQFDQAKLQDERQHEQQIELGGRQWRREKAFDLLVAFNDMQRTAMNVVMMFHSGFRKTGEWQAENIDTGLQHVQKLISEGIYCESLISLIDDESLARDARSVAIEITAIAESLSLYELELASRSTMQSHSNIMKRIGEYAQSL